MKLLTPAVTHLSSIKCEHMYTASATSTSHCDLSGPTPTNTLAFIDHVPSFAWPSIPSRVWSQVLCVLRQTVCKHGLRYRLLEGREREPPSAPNMEAAPTTRGDFTSIFQLLLIWMIFSLMPTVLAGLVCMWQ